MGKLDWKSLNDFRENNIYVTSLIRAKSYNLELEQKSMVINTTQYFVICAHLPLHFISLSTIIYSFKLILFV